MNRIRNHVCSVRFRLCSIAAFGKKHVETLFSLHYRSETKQLLGHEPGLLKRPGMTDLFTKRSELLPRVKVYCNRSCLAAERAYLQQKSEQSLCDLSLHILVDNIREQRLSPV